MAHGLPSRADAVHVRPWVGDGGHGYRPEIHPAERIWWRDGDRLKLIAVQDARSASATIASSNGPTRASPADGTLGRPQHAGRVPRRLRGGGGAAPPAQFAVEQMLDANVRGVTPPVAAADMQYAFTHQGTDVGSVRVRLGLGATSERLELALSTLDIAPDDVVSGPTGRTLQGYLRLHDVIGYRHQEGEGFNTFEVVPPPLLDPALPEAADPACPACAASTRDDTHDRLHVAVLIVCARGAGRSLHDDVGDRARGPPAAATEKPDLAPLLARAAREKENAADIVMQSARPIPPLRAPSLRRATRRTPEAAVNEGDRETFRKLLAAAGAPVPETVQWDVHVRNFSQGTAEEAGPVPARRRSPSARR